MAVGPHRRAAPSRRGPDGHPDAQSWTGSRPPVRSSSLSTPEAPLVVVLTTFDLDEHVYARGPAPARAGSSSRTSHPDVLVHSCADSRRGGEAMVASARGRAASLNGAGRGADDTAAVRVVGDRLTDRGSARWQRSVARGLSNHEISARLFLSRGDGQDLRVPAPDQAVAARPGAGRGAGLRDRSRPSGGGRDRSVGVRRGRPGRRPERDRRGSPAACVPRTHAGRPGGRRPSASGTATARGSGRRACRGPGRPPRPCPPAPAGAPRARWRQ